MKHQKRGLSPLTFVRSTTSHRIAVPCRTVASYVTGISVECSKQSCPVILVVGMVVKYVYRVLVALTAFRMNFLVLESSGQQVGRWQRTGAVVGCDKPLE